MNKKLLSIVFAVLLPVYAGCSVKTGVQIAQELQSKGLILKKEQSADGTMYIVKANGSSGSSDSVCNALKNGNALLKLALGRSVDINKELNDSNFATNFKQQCQKYGWAETEQDPQQILLQGMRYTRSAPGSLTLFENVDSQSGLMQLTSTITKFPHVLVGSIQGHYLAMLLTNDQSGRSFFIVINERQAGKAEPNQPVGPAQNVGPSTPTPSATMAVQCVADIQDAVYRAYSNGINNELAVPQQKKLLVNNALQQILGAIPVNGVLSTEEQNRLNKFIDLIHIPQETLRNSLHKSWKTLINQWPNKAACDDFKQKISDVFNVSWLVRPTNEPRSPSVDAPSVQPVPTFASEVPVLVAVPSKSLAQASTQSIQPAAAVNPAETPAQPASQGVLVSQQCISDVKKVLQKITVMEHNVNNKDKKAFIIAMYNFLAELNDIGTLSSLQALSFQNKITNIDALLVQDFGSLERGYIKSDLRKLLISWPDIKQEHCEKLQSDLQTMFDKVKK